MSPSVTQLHGWTSEEAKTLSLEESLTPESYQKMLETVTTDIVSGKMSSICEVDTYHKDGSIIQAEMIITSICGSNGEISGYVTTMRNISERKQTEDALRESEERYRLITDNISDVIAVTDSNQNITYISPSVMQLRGYTPEEVLAMTMEESYPPESYKLMMDTVIADMHRIDLEGGKLKQSSLIYVDIYHKDGSTIPVELVITFIYGDDGEISNYVTILRDISERKQAEEALRESEGKFKSLIEHGSDLIVIIEADSSIRYQSLSFEHVLGYKPEELVGTSTLDLIHPDDLPSMSEKFADLLNHPGNISTVTMRVRHKNGSYYHFEATGQNLLDDTSVAGITVNLHNVTERNQAEEELQRKEEYYRSLIENSSNGIVIMNADGTTRYTSPSYDRMLGLDPGERIGALGFEFIHPDDLEQMALSFAQMIQGSNSNTYAEVRIKHKDGSWRYVEATATNLLDNPAVTGIVGNFNDISERKAAEGELSSKMRELEKFNNVAVDRELKMIELKEEINRLLTEAGSKEKYKTPE